MSNRVTIETETSHETLLVDAAAVVSIHMDGHSQIQMRTVVVCEEGDRYLVLAAALGAIASTLLDSGRLSDEAEAACKSLVELGPIEKREFIG